VAEGLAWEEWVKRHGAAALLFARQYCRTQADAVQDGFVRFLYSVGHNEKDYGGAAKTEKNAKAWDIVVRRRSEDVEVGVGHDSGTLAEARAQWPTPSRTAGFRL
jgi:hypothetical protein